MAFGFPVCHENRWISIYHLARNKRHVQLIATTRGIAMKPNFVDPDMTHSRADIAAQNRETDRLCAAILPQAQALVEQAVAQHTAQAANEVLTSEAEAMLKSMLAEFDDGID